MFHSDLLARILPPDRLDNAVQLLEERALEKVALMAEEIQAIGAAATSKPIATVEEEGLASELVARGVIALKELDSLRRSLVDPLNAQVKAINGVFKVVTDPCEALCGKGGKLERLILVFRQQERARIQREQDEARRKQEEAARKEAEALAKADRAKSEAAREKALAEAAAASRAQTEAALAAPAAMSKGTRTDSGSLTEREAWTFEVVQPDLVPREYLMVDQAAIRKAVAAGVRTIPGVNITQEARLTRRVG